MPVAGGAGMAPLTSGGLAQAAESCRALFTGGLQTHGAGGVVFQWGGTLQNNPSQLIDTPCAEPWGAPSCGSRDCQASGMGAADFAGLALPEIKGEHDLSLGYLGVGEAGGGDLNRYRTISVDGGATLSFNARHQAYYIQRLSIGYGAKVTLAPGRYWIGQLDMASSSQLLIAGGNARVMVGSSLNLPYQASLNGEGSAEALQLFVRGNLSLESSATVGALAYVEGDYRGPSPRACVAASTPAMPWWTPPRASKRAWTPSPPWAGTPNAASAVTWMATACSTCSTRTPMATAMTTRPSAWRAATRATPRACPRWRRPLPSRASAPRPSPRACRATPPAAASASASTPSCAMVSPPTCRPAGSIAASPPSAAVAAPRIASPATRLRPFRNCRPSSRPAPASARTWAPRR